MSPPKTKIINVKGIPVATFKADTEDYISLTDIARNKNPDEPKDVVKNWMRSKTTIEFLGLWEQLNNPGFKGVEFDPFLYEAGSNAFTLSPSKWIETTNAIGLVSKQGNNGGTFSEWKDISEGNETITNCNGLTIEISKSYKIVGNDQTRSNQGI